MFLLIPLNNQFTASHNLGNGVTMSCDAGVGKYVFLSSDWTEITSYGTISLVLPGKTFNEDEDCVPAPIAPFSLQNGSIFADFGEGDAPAVAAFFTDPGQSGIRVRVYQNGGKYIYVMTNEDEGALFVSLSQ